MEDMLKLYSHDSLFSSLLEYRVLQNISAIVQFHKTCRGGTLRLRPSKCVLLILMFIFPSYSSLMKEDVGTVVENIFFR